MATKKQLLSKKKKIIETEYNKCYTNNPKKWANNASDLFTFNIISKYLKEKIPKSFLDIGCGNGHTVDLFSREWSETDCWGLDLSSVAIKLATEKVPSATFVCSSIEDFPPQKFEVVTSIGVFEHIENHNTMFSKLHNVVGGILYIEVPNCIGYVISEDVEGFRRLNGGSRQMEWHLYKETWEERITSAGFEIIESIRGQSIYRQFVWIVKKK